MSEHVEHGFGPVWDRTSQVLVLGSMPSPRSREAGFYYMHRRNRFWPVMGLLLGNEHEDDMPGDDVDSRRGFALRHHIALWDVIASCDITGASDASIRNVTANDVTPLLRGSRIGHVFTTGAKAAQLYRRFILPGLETHGVSVPLTVLPSTSPANASMSLTMLADAYGRAFEEAGIQVNRVTGQVTDRTVRTSIR